MLWPPHECTNEPHPRTMRKLSVLCRLLYYGTSFLPRFPPSLDEAPRGIGMTVCASVATFRSGRIANSTPACSLDVRGRNRLQRCTRIHSRKQRFERTTHSGGSADKLSLSSSSYIHPFFLGPSARKFVTPSCRDCSAADLVATAKCALTAARRRLYV